MAKATVSFVPTNTITVPLSDALEGHHLLIDEDRLTFGLLEDLQGERIDAVLDSLAGVIVGGDLPKGTDRQALRNLPIKQMRAVCAAVLGQYNTPKNA